MTPLERLMQEAIPTRPDPAPKADRQTRLPGWWTPEEQARHWAELGEAIDGWVWDDDQRAAERRHLRLIEEADDETNAA
ncbi:hypothetical protein ACH4UM_18765 [Streptomyces sp. NPDC020801]|uniref:hypothetical protein n=1 Tax=Streptomyces sp. NPDC020801 TaxID=3365093 RepID=UPI0037B4662B